MSRGMGRPQSLLILSRVAHSDKSYEFRYQSRLVESKQSYKTQAIVQVEIKFTLTCSKAVAVPVKVQIQFITNCLMHSIVIGAFLLMFDQLY